MNEIIKPKSVNFEELVRNSNTTLTLNSQSKMISLLTEEFTDKELQWYIANLYIYLNYHPNDEYPINLENVYKMLGFANKGNAMKTIKSNFIENDDYKIIKFTKNLYEDKAACTDGKAASSSKNLGGAGLNREDVMLNVDTFKNLAMLVKTPEGTEIRKYYIKMENIHNKVVKMEIIEQKLIQETTSKLLKEKEQIIEENKNELQSKELLIKKKDKELKQLAKKISLGWLYAGITDNINGVSKVGISDEILKRIDGHLSSNPGFKYVFSYQSKNNKLIEKCVKTLLEPFLTCKSEWFNIDSEDLIYIINFFIDLFDTNNGSEDPKMIIDYIQRLRSKNIIEKNSDEYVPDKIYDEFFEENIDTLSDRMYRGKPIPPKLTFVQLQSEIEIWIKKNNYNIQIRNNNSNFLEKFKNDIKRYVKFKYNLVPTSININDIKKQIASSGNLGYIGIKLKKNQDTDNFFSNCIYKNYYNNNIILQENGKITTKELSHSFHDYLIENKIQIPINLITKNGQFSYLFKSEFTHIIETLTNIKSTKKISTKKFSGYPGFIGIAYKI